MIVSREDAEDFAILSGLDGKEVWDLYERYSDDNVVFVRASEICERKVHHMNAPHPSTRRRLARDSHGIARKYPDAWNSADTTPAGLRMHLGNEIEDWLVKEVLTWSHGWSYEQYPLEYYYEDLAVVMIGHVDGITTFDLPNKIGEVKSTSNARYHEVLAAIDYPEEVYSETFEKYRRQMMTYAAMMHLHPRGKPVQSFSPCFGVLGVVNRDSCDYEVREVKLFDEDVDIEAWLQQRIRDAIGDVHPLVGEADKPNWAGPSHPICKSCKFTIDCWGEKPELPLIDDQEAVAYAETYCEGDRLVHLGEIYKRSAKDFFGILLDDRGVDKLKLTEDVSVSRHTRKGSTRVDVDKLKADGLYDDYTTSGRPYEVMRVNVKG